MMRALILALFLVAPSAATSAHRGDALLRHAVLGAHNEARERFGVPALAWNEQLAADAMAHAQYMARTGIYGHDRTPGRRKKAGENIWRGQRGAFSYQAMVGVMVDESRNFRPGVFPNVSRTGDWSEVGHFTQIVWPTTTEVGCALASSASTDYFVCRYAPTGNKDGYQLAERRD